MSVEKASSDDSRNKIVLGVVVVVAVLLLIGLAVFIYNKQKVGKSSDPAAQKAALTLLETIPVKGPAPKTGYSRDQFGPPWTDDVDVEGGHNGCDTRDDILRRDLSNVVPPSGCTVLSGVLHDPYTGKDIQFNREEGTDVLVQIDSELRLLAAVRRSIRERGGEPSSRQVDELLDERLAHRGRAAGSAQKLLQVSATCRTTPTYC